MSAAPMGDYEMQSAARVTARLRILGEVSEERARQEQLHPIQDLPDGTGPEYRAWADMAKANGELAESSGDLTWRHVLEEEFEESLSETDPALLRAELLQTAAVCVRWVEAIDRRAA